MSTERTRIEIKSIYIQSYVNNEVHAKANIINSGLVGIALPEFTIIFTPQECEELKVFTDKVIKRALDELRKKL